MCGFVTLRKTIGYFSIKRKDYNVEKTLDSSQIIVTIFAIYEVNNFHGNYWIGRINTIGIFLSRKYRGI